MTPTTRQRLRELHERLIEQDKRDAERGVLSRSRASIEFEEAARNALAGKGAE